MFDDTVYFLSFDTEQEARSVLRMLTSKAATSLLSSLIFWDEKRPIKTSILNVLDWSRLQATDQPEELPDDARVTRLQGFQAAL